ncbi:ABC transporter ATP-binding protein [Streptomyces sp. SP18CS02]|uniref:ABC transporter ATP-binding protein n=1 Tax=Streptomyces sp. SP18CS02 TaxID=3002531 RepID=UPI002E7883B8|nr:ABC transporter ATP-binding protein [Streptomyces sp. SP18CS02]MEE1752032.1 ABC transporter ATP-binding protein [Streptomyces sp. SP18CS02]
MTSPTPSDREDGPPAPPAGPPGTADRVLLRAARHSRGRAAAILVCSVASAAATLAEPAVLGHALDLLLSEAPAAPRWIALCAALIVADILLDAAAALLTGTTNARSTAWLRRHSLARLLAAAPHHAARFAPGDLATRLTANATEAGTVPATAAGAIASLLPPLGALAALLLIDPWTAAAFLAGVPLLLLLLRTFARSSSDSVSRYQSVQSAIADRLVEALTGARSIAAAGTADRERRRVLAPLPELAVEGRRMWQVYGRAVASSGVLMPLLVCVVLAVGGLRLASGALGVGELLAASRYAALAAGAGAVAGLLGSLVRGRTAARRTGELMALPPLTHGRLTLPDGPGRLELRGVTVVRDGTTVLNGVDLVVPGGSTAAVVGRSGAGKSVLAAVAGRLSDPDDGQVLLDGVPLDRVERRRLRQEISYAFARPALFGETLRDVIAFGDRAPDDPALRSAARAAGADGFIQRLPGGYRTALPDAPLSGGEYQRLGLARAFAHAGRLLILDDATSSLDTVTERQVERALTRDVRSGTRLVVAHRLSSAARADLVVWLDEGRVRGVGPHRTLWRDPAYRAVFAAAAVPPASSPSPEPSPDPSPPPAVADVPPRGDGPAAVVDPVRETIR